MTLEVLTAEDLRAAISIESAISAVRHAFACLGRGEFEMPVRTALGEGRFLTMSALHRPTRTAVVKSLSVVADRRPAIAGAVVFLSEGETLTRTLDAATVTALRTGAVVGVATDALASPDSSHLVLIGLGAQAPDQLRAVRAVRPIDRVTLVDRSLQTARTFQERWATDLEGCTVQLSAEVTAAVQSADVICCATPSTEPLFEGGAVPARVHVNAIGAYRWTMRELPNDLLGEALVVVDQREAALEESGEIHHALRAGLIADSDLVELSGVLGGALAEGHRPARTVFKSVGLAIQDWAIGYALNRTLGEVN